MATPGPWTVEVYKEHTNVECACFTVAADVSNEDAHLIAAAPAMLEALKEIARLANYADEVHPATQAKGLTVGDIRRARAAIQLAEGK